MFTKKKLDEMKYEAQLNVDANFGEVGAILVTNVHRKEMYLKEIVLHGLPQGIVHFTCDSWIHSSCDNPEKRIFFTNKSYLPSQTPAGLKSWRERELRNLRGDGEGERMDYDRIYDYDVYNDLGDPDTDPDLARAVLGGKGRPYPRRCRTGRPHCKSDPMSETRGNSDFYVPRDEAFADSKRITFSTNILDNVIRSLIPTLEAMVIDANIGFSNFKHINDLFHDGVTSSSKLKNFAAMIESLPGIILHSTDNFVRFPAPNFLERDHFGWFRDEEFTRETLAGSNPCSITLVKEWPLVSNLDPQIYGPPESAITTELVEEQIGGAMPLCEAIKQKKLFMLDYHDLLLPYVNKVRELKGCTLYGSRTLFFLTRNETLRPVAIELTRPPTPDGKGHWKQVYTPYSFDSTDSWLWRIAKAHVLSHDSAHHQIDSHWLRTHCSVEPYIIATNRQLSSMHPIFKLLNPYFRYTMEINCLARESLINAGGIIESTFSTGKYSMEFGSMVYDKVWRFDHQALPADLVSRGLAVEDPSSPYGIKLTIQDYPYANDGLLLWAAIEKWVTDYVTHYYPSQEVVQSDEEIQQWWAEIRTKGHEDKKDEPWWPKLETAQDLIRILTTMIWVTSGHHAAVNFGQYMYGGYFPNRPTTSRVKMPSEDPTQEEWDNFLNNPCSVLLDTFPSQVQGTKVMTVLNVLSSHSPDEEYIGDQIEPAWADDPVIEESFQRFHLNLKEIESIIDLRNADVNLRNRNGAGIIPYELLKPFSQSGVTGMGVPNSISI
ncbi:linoleate 13S-lipoxygenase 2-1, chloroplastic-like [Silene latifolia]|uniref:linoleate 13S-lipoxygenase 2-1, chloroplastic-like n=1 Tax=Silene latifolia TaxID=37657 RepID=UPI003D775090